MYRNLITFWKITNGNQEGKTITVPEVKYNWFTLLDFYVCGKYEGQSYHPGKHSTTNLDKLSLHIMACMPEGGLF